MLKHKWENAFTIDSLSWGYAREDNLNLCVFVRADCFNSLRLTYSMFLCRYLNITTLLYEVVSTVACKFWHYQY